MIASLAGRRVRGFTFAELLAAMAFMAITIPAAVQAIMIANRAGVVAERKRVAARLADRVLSEVILTEDWQNGDTSGDFGDDAPGYHWELVEEPWEVEGELTLLTIQVFYPAQGDELSVHLSTLVDETAGEEE